MQVRKTATNIVFMYVSSLMIVLSIVSSANEYSFEKHFYNSDTLYLPSVYNDLFIEQNSISDFNLNPAPNFFPDMLFHFILMKVCNSNYTITAVIFASFQFFFLIVLFKGIGYRLCKNNQTVINLGICILMLFSMPSIYENNFLFTFYLLINSYHLGSFLFSLVLLLLVYQYLYEEKDKKVLVIIFTLITVVSDKSIFINFVAPIVLTMVLLIIKNKINKKAGVVMLSSVLLGALFGLVFLVTAEKFNWLIIPSDGVSIDLEKMIDSLYFFIKSTFFYLKEFSFVSLLILLSISSYLLNIVLIFKERKELPFLELYFLIFSTVIILSPILTGKITGLDSIRYNYHSLVLLTFLFPYFLNRVILKRSMKNKSKIEIIVFLPIFLLIIIKFSPDMLERKINLYPIETKLIDINKKRLGLKNGLSTYWKSKKNTMFSKENTLIRCVHEDLKPHTHVASRKWYFKKGENTIYNFIIIDNNKMLKTVLDKFDSVETVQLSKDLLIAKTEPFFLDEQFNFMKLKEKQ